MSAHADYNFSRGRINLLEDAFLRIAHRTAAGKGTGPSVSAPKGQEVVGGQWKEDETEAVAALAKFERSDRT